MNFQQFITLIVFIAWPWITAAAVSDASKNWAVKGAPYRVFLQSASPPDALEAGWEIRLPDFTSGREDMRDVVMIGADGNEIALDSIWRGNGRSRLLLAESMPSNGLSAVLYFGGQAARRTRSWNATRSLLLETRRLPVDGKITSPEGWLHAWEKSQGDIDGAAFVSHIFHGENPFGKSDHYLSRFTGILKTGNGGARRFYSLSDDVSYVWLDGRLALQWRQDHPPPLAPAKVPVATVQMPLGLMRVDYRHAAVDANGAMVLGWENEQKLGTVPAEAWIHPGKVTFGAFESSDGTPVPVASLLAEQYLGFGNHWYVKLRCSIPDPGLDWRVEWLWPDGYVDQRPECRRLWLGLSPAKVILRLRKGKKVIEGRRLLVIPRELEAASVNHDGQLKEFLGLLSQEQPRRLDEPSRKAGFVLSNAFLPYSAIAATWADAWLEQARPGAGPWIEAVSLAIRSSARKDPNTALKKIVALTPECLTVLGIRASMLELEIRVLDLHKPKTIEFIQELTKSPDRLLAQMAMIRLGDFHLLNQRIEEARSCLEQAAPQNQSAAQKAPVIDRAYSLAIDALLKSNHLEEAYTKFEQWERQRPIARIDADQLLWRARLMAASGNWKRALRDLQISTQIRPGSPEEIEVLFWQGRALYELGHKDDARKFWNTLIKDYPKHSLTEVAKQWTQKP